MRGDRARVFGSSLEQAQQLFAAAAFVDYASRPILLFYGLSQAGRAIAAASSEAGNNDWKLSGHGVKILDLDQRPALHSLTVIDDGVGSFTQLAPLLHGGSLPSGATLGALWAAVPNLSANPLRAAGIEYLPVLTLDHLSEDGRPNFSSWVHGLPLRFAGAYSEDELRDYLAHYPTLACNFGEPVQAQPALNLGGGSISVRRAWTLEEEDDPGSFYRRHTWPYLGDDDCYVFPSIGGDRQPLHPLLGWWAILLALSMLARYEPAGWTAHLDVDESPHAVPLESLLDQALDTCPQIVLHAIRAVSS